jgi:hypothetical protein
LPVELRRYGLVQRLGVEPSRSGGHEGYSLAGVRPRPTLQYGAQCRLSACDIRFVGPTLFTSELTGHDWRPLAVTIRSHQVDSLAATPVASVVRLAADLRLERSASRLTVRFPHPVGPSAKQGSGAECGSRTRLICLEGRGPKPLDQPRSQKIEGFVSRFTAPRLHATDRSVRRTLGGGFRAVGERGSFALVTCLPPALRRRQGQSELDRVDSGQKLPEQRMRPRRAVAAGRGTRIECFSDCSDHGARFVRVPDSEVKRRVNTSRAT